MLAGLRAAQGSIARESMKKAARTRVKQKVGSISSLLTKQTRKGIEMQEGANSLTRCNYGHHKCYIPQTVLATLQKQIKVLNAATKSTSTVGTQAVYNFSALEPSTLLAMLPSVNDKMIIRGLKAEISLVNSSSTNSALTIYDCICRKDCSVSANSSAVNAWGTGVDSAGGSATDYQTIGSIPEESVTFNEFYKVVQRTRINLAPGELHRHEIYYSPEKVLSGLYLTNVPYGIAGITTHTMFVHHGMPAHDSTTTTNVTIDQSDLDIVIKFSYDWRELENSVTNWTKSNTLATSFAVGEQFVNEAVGQVQDTGGLHPGTLHS